MNLQRWTRIGLLLLPIGAATYATTIVPRGHWLEARDPMWAEWVLSDGFRAYASATVNGTGWAAFGVLCLYLWLRESGLPGEGRVFWATMLSINGALTLMPALGMMAMEWPHLAEAGASHVAAATTESGFWLLWLTWSAVTFGLGSLLFAWALWDRGHRGAAIAYGAGGVLAGVPFWFWLEVAGTMVWFAGTVWIAWLAWRTQSPATQALQPP